MKSSVLVAWAIVVLAATALVVRMVRLEERTMHPDEANQAVRAALLLQSSDYDYDPSDHHGPSLYYFTQPIFWLCGTESLAESREWQYRVVAVLFSVGVILLLGLVVDGLGRPEAIVAGLLTLLSPAMFFYSRYYVQEMLLVFFTFATIGCGWRYAQSQKLRWAILFGGSIGMMHATKETWVMAAAAMFGAIVVVTAAAWYRGRRDASAAKPLLDSLRLAWRSYLLAAVLMGLSGTVIAVVFYSAFGHNWRGPLDSVLAYINYFHRGSQGGQSGEHAHPWYFYAQLLLAYRPAKGFFWTEGLVGILAIFGGAAAWWSAKISPQQRVLCRLLSVYTLLLAGVYSAIPYKTPWCALSFWHTAILLAGVGAVAFVRWMPGRLAKAVAVGLLAMGFAHLGWECYALNFRFAGDQRNPYVYAHTSADVKNLAAQVERLAACRPEGANLRIHVISPDNYWPLPWYLRQVPRASVGYWEDAKAWGWDTIEYPLPDNSLPDLIILTADVQEAVDAQLKTPYNQQMLYGLRQGVFVSVYVKEDLWKTFLEHQKP